MDETKLEKLARLSTSKALDALARRGFDIRGKLSAPISRVPRRAPLEGAWPHPRLVIIEFPSRAAAEGWYRSADYQKIISLRLSGSIGNVIIVDGHDA
jgi:uncharacterized protein (DUF1330 family)